MRESGARFSIWDKTQAPDIGQVQGPEPTPVSGASGGCQDSQRPETYPRLCATPLTLPAPQPRAPGFSSVTCPHFSSCLSLPLNSDSLPFAYNSLSKQTPLSPAPLGGNHTLFFHLSVWLLPATMLACKWVEAGPCVLAPTLLVSLLISWELPNSRPLATNSHPYTPDCFKYSTN